MPNCNSKSTEMMRMSEINGYASAADILGNVGARRYAERIVGGRKVRIQSLTALEYAGIEATATRAALEARGGSRSKQVRALADANAELIALCLVDGNGDRLFSIDRKAELLSLDSGTSQALASACMEHCGIDGAELETLAKNSSQVAD